MSMQLKKSRGLFFARTREPQKSFWAHPDFRELVKKATGKDVPQDLLDWDACAVGARSNCPALHDRMISVSRLVDPEWRDRVDTIYVGRTYSNEDTAEANKNQKGGMVAISNEYTSIMVAYSAMWGRFLSAADRGLKQSSTESNLIWIGLRKHLDESIDDFRSGGLLALKGNLLMVFQSEESRQSAFSGIEQAESWTIAHEISHHLVRDMSNRRDERVVDLLKNITSRSSASREIARMSQAQRDEINADLLATLILSGHFAEVRHPIDVPAVISGAALALITIAHFRDEWTSEPTDSHPGCLDRIRIILTIMCEMHGKESVFPDDPGRSHVVLYRVAGWLRTYADWVHGLVDSDHLTILAEYTLNSMEFGVMADVGLK